MSGDTEEKRKEKQLGESESETVVTTESSATYQVFRWRNLSLTNGPVKR